MDPEKKLTEKESLDLINQMITKAKDSYRDTGIGAIMWGSVVAVCGLVRLSELQFNYQLPFDIFLLTFVAVIPQIFITIREKKERKVKSYDDAYMDYIWLGFGISVVLMIVVVNKVYDAWGPVAAEYRTLTGHSASFSFMDHVSSLFLILYGLPTFVTGAACRFKPMFWGGLFCWVCCIISLYTGVKMDMLLIALSAIVAWLIPGMIIESAYRKSKRQ